jgi:uncharacterized membrane protein YtjA (UPF0391 family)
MSDNHRSREMKFYLVGWILFLICAVLFIASSIRNHDVLSLIASIIFLVGCVIFLIPLVAAITAGNTTETPSRDR